jgi:hypothetical protein
MSLRRKQERLDLYAAAANELQWPMIEKDSSGLVNWLLDFRIFKMGSDKKVSPLLLKKEDELEFTALFDYAYTVSSGKSSATFRQSVFFRYSKALALPHFFMLPEKWYHRVESFFGAQDIDFIEYPEFSKNYLLRGKDEEYVRHHFNHPAMIRYFDRHAKFYLEGMNYLMVLYQNNVLQDLSGLTRLVRVGNTLHNFFTDKTPQVELPPDLTFNESDKE